MHKAPRFARFAAVIAVAVAAVACALPASASTPNRAKGQPSAAAIAAWSASYRAREKAYLTDLASHGLLPSPAALQAWSDDYRAMQSVYQQQQLAQARREATAFNFGDAFVGGGVVLALAALAATGFYVLRTRRLGAAPLA
jgi:hypothetical protein